MLEVRDRVAVLEARDAADGPNITALVAFMTAEKAEKEKAQREARTARGWAKAFGAAIAVYVFDNAPHWFAAIAQGWGG